MATEDLERLGEIEELLDQTLAALPTLPALSEADDGKVIAVVGGLMTAVNLAASDVSAVAFGRNITTGALSGLDGGGDLTADRSLVVDPTRATELTAPADDDFALVSDTSASSVLRKVQIGNLFKAIAGLTVGAPATTDEWLFLDGGVPKKVTHTNLIAALAMINEVTLETFTTTRTGVNGWLPGDDLIAALVIVTGAGAGGGGAKANATGNSFAAAGGGGAGATAWGLFTAAQIATHLNASSRLDLHIGAAGVAGTSTANGGAGGTTAIKSPTGGPLMAGGGLGGVKAVAAAGQTVCQVGGIGGVATAGTIRSRGQNGFAGHVMGQNVLSGAGAPSFWSGGAAAVLSGTVAGGTAGQSASTPTILPGAGGSGAVRVKNASTSNGGSGGPGMIVILSFRS